MEDLIKAIQDLGQYTYWDYILFGVNVISVIVSVIALVFAIRLPIKIAKSQNDVALFEKRCECYVAVQTLLVCAKQLEGAKTNKNIQVAFRYYIDSPENITQNSTPIVFAAQLTQKQAIVIGGAFLFSHFNFELIQDIINAAIELIVAVSDIKLEEIDKDISNRAMQLKNKYCELCKQFEDTYLGAMEKELQLSKKTR